MISFMIAALALTTAASEPATYILSNGIYTSPISAALFPAAAPLLSPISSVAAPLSAPVTTSVESVAPLAPVAPITSVSDYRYSYGSSYNYQDYYPLVNSALSLPYSLPYTYADWFYRR